MLRGRASEQAVTSCTYSSCDRILALRFIHVSPTEAITSGVGYAFASDQRCGKGLDMGSRRRISILGAALAIPAAAGNLARPLVRVPIDETQRTKLRRNVRPLAQGRYDQGVVPDSLSADRVPMLLNRPPERETAMQQFPADAHLKDFPNYQHWHTPQQFGEQFGPADSDVQAVSS